MSRDGPKGKEGHITHIRKSTSRQPHSCTTHQRAPHNQQIRVRILHVLADLLDERQDNQRGHRVTDEGRHDEYQRREHDQHAIQAEALDAVRNTQRNRMEQARGGDGLAKREAARRQDDNGPEKVVEVFFRQDAGAEEEYHWDDGDDAHVAEYAVQLVTEAPEYDGHESGDADEPLQARESVFYRAYWHDVGALRWERN